MPIFEGLAHLGMIFDFLGGGGENKREREREQKVGGGSD